ncbi:AIPR family protein [Bifidobacterium moukalabense]
MMLTVEEYRHELWREVTERAQDHEIYDQEAFFETTCEILRDSEAITAYHPAYTRYRMGTSQALAIDGYDQDAFEMDESIVVIACDDKFTLDEDDTLPTIQSNECKRYFNAMHRFVASAWNGTYQARAEESSETFEFAQFIHEHRTSISRIRLYFITDREYTGRDDSSKSQIDRYTKDGEDYKVSWETHIWDIRRLMESSRAGLIEHTSIVLENGLPAVKASGYDESMDTYLLFVTGNMLSKWYRKYGSKLMEANVRSFLSMRGKVNKGIRQTLNENPDRFVAYNNGLTATATCVKLNERGCITRLDDLQIVNGGQTTASIFYTEQKDRTDLSRVIVPVKLVVVHESVARELVPYISRFTNSQNKVAEADFSSNSEYQVKLERLSRATLTPPLPGAIQTHWYYERARGQYESERDRLDTTARKSFERANPSKQRIKMVEAPKYLMCWDQQPQVASLGLQKCFAKFVNSQKDDAASNLDADFYKRLVCKKIVFDTVYKHIKHTDWFLGAYQSNIAEYAVAKYSQDLKRAGTECDFSAIWRRQSIDPEMLGCLMKAGQQASKVLNDPRRPVQNVSEWAKKDQCWANLKKHPSCLDADPVELAVEKPRHASRRKTNPSTTSDIVTPRHGAMNDSQTTVDEELIHDWRKLTAESCRRLYDFASGKAFLSPKSEASLRALMDGRDDSINVNSLNYLISLCVKAGFPLSSLSGRNDEGPTDGQGVSPSSDVHRMTHREFLLAIPEQNWSTIIDWGRSHYLISDDTMAELAKLSRGGSLSDQEIDSLWQLRERIVRNGFPRSVFAPRA